MQNAIYPNNDFTSTSSLIFIVSSFTVFYISLCFYMSLLHPVSLSLFRIVYLSLFLSFLSLFFYLCLSMFVFRVAFFLYLSFAVFCFLYFFPTFRSSFNACYPNRCLPALSKTASGSSSSFLPLFHSLCYLFLSVIPAFLFIFFCLSLSIYVHLPIFVSLSFFPQYIKAMQYTIIYKHLKP